jgi:hypothetical protein
MTAFHRTLVNWPIGIGFAVVLGTVFERYPTWVAVAVFVVGSLCLGALTFFKAESQPITWRTGLSYAFQLTLYIYIMIMFARAEQYQSLDAGALLYVRDDPRVSPFIAVGIVVVQWGMPLIFLLRFTIESIAAIRRRRTNL